MMQKKFCHVWCSIPWHLSSVCLHTIQSSVYMLFGITEAAASRWIWILLSDGSLSYSTWLLNGNWISACCWYTTTVAYAVIAFLPASVKSEHIVMHHFCEKSLLRKRRRVPLKLATVILKCFSCVSSVDLSVCWQCVITIWICAVWSQEQPVAFYDLNITYCMYTAWTLEFSCCQWTVCEGYTVPLCCNEIFVH